MWINIVVQEAAKEMLILVYGKEEDEKRGKSRGVRAGKTKNRQRYGRKVSEISKNGHFIGRFRNRRGDYEQRYGRKVRKIQKMPKKGG